MFAEVPCNPLNPKCDQHLISPYNFTAESFIKVARIKEIISNERFFDFYTNSPFRNQRKRTEKSMENVDADVRA